MFTGLVEEVGELLECKPTSGGRRLRIGSALAFAMTGKAGSLNDTRSNSTRSPVRAGAMSGE